MAVVTLDRLTKNYAADAPPAADGVTLHIGDGEFMVLLGPSGCGKTTTLRMIAGLESITSGELSIDGQVVNRVSAKDRDIAMVFQSYALYPHMSVRENLAFGLRRRRVAKSEIESRVTNVAEALGLSPFLARKPHALSGGQRQRVALGRAIVRDPQVFLFDEPLSNLDAALRASTRAEIAALHQRLGATMIYVTHDQVEAMTLGTRICVMNGGKIAQVGSPLDVYNRPADTFVASFLGAPPMNLEPVTPVSDGEGPQFRLGDAVLSIREDRVEARASQHAATFGVRPEHVSLTPAPHGRSQRVAATIERIEALGAESIVAARPIGVNAPLVARLAGVPTLRHGERCEFFVDLDHAHLFDADGKTLVRTSNTGEPHG